MCDLKKKNLNSALLQKKKNKKNNNNTQTLDWKENTRSNVKTLVNLSHTATNGAVQCNPVSYVLSPVANCE